ncbi:hypothetical protein PMAYCL1PPCAC_08014, partial [Pristionchus mayeri]
VSAMADHPIENAVGSVLDVMQSLEESNVDPEIMGVSLELIRNILQNIEKCRSIDFRSMAVSLCESIETSMTWVTSMEMEGGSSMNSLAYEILLDDNSTKVS